MVVVVVVVAAVEGVVWWRVLGCGGRCGRVCGACVEPSRSKSTSLGAWGLQGLSSTNLWCFGRLFILGSTLQLVSERSLDGLGLQEGFASGFRLAWGSSLGFRLGVSAFGFVGFRAYG